MTTYVIPSRGRHRKHRSKLLGKIGDYLADRYHVARLQVSIWAWEIEQARKCRIEFDRIAPGATEDFVDVLRNLPKVKNNA